MIVVFSHPKGGVGKTTLLFNFCVSEQKKGKDFVVIDLDGQHSISSVNQLRILEGLEPLNIITFSKEKDLVNYLNNNQDKYIVIDTGGFDSSFNRIAVAYSDLVITPISDSPLEQIRAMTDFTKILSDIEKEIERKLSIYIVLNRIHHSNSEKGILSIKESLKNDTWSFFDSSISDSSSIKFSLGTGKSLVEYEKKKGKKSVKEMKSFFKEINKLTNIG